MAGSLVPHAAAALAHLSGPEPGLLHRRAPARREARKDVGTEAGLPPQYGSWTAEDNIKKKKKSFQACLLCPQGTGS